MDMSTSGSVSDGVSRVPPNASSSPESIYERPRKRASDRDGLVTRAVTGAVVGAAFWLVAADLGFPQIAGIGGLAFLLPFVALGALLGITRFRRVMLWPAAALIVLFLVIAWTDLIRAPARRLIRTDPLPARADAIVVLSAGVTSDGLLQQQSLDRLIKGIELVRAGIAARLIVTREQKRIGNAVVTSAEDQNRVIALGGDIEVITTGVVASTREEAMRVAEMSKRNNWSRIVLVTSPFHSRRACATFEKAGLVVSCVPSDSRDVAVRRLSGPDTRLRAFSLWIYEVAGTIRYRQAGWI